MPANLRHPWEVVLGPQASSLLRGSRVRIRLFEPFEGLAVTGLDVTHDLQGRRVGDEFIIREMDGQ